MANLLYVTCNVMPQERSRTLTLGSRFLEEYLRVNPHDDVQILDLYRDSIQRVDQDILTAWQRIERNKDYELFSDDERRKIGRILRLAEQFGRCDKYVFVTHSLNLWFPAEFKMYIDAICVPNLTYRVTPLGAKGLLASRPRKSLHLHASTVFAFGQEQDLSTTFLHSVLNFLGVADQKNVIIEGDWPEPGAKEEDTSTWRWLMEFANHF